MTTLRSIKRAKEVERKKQERQAQQAQENAAQGFAVILTAKGRYGVIAVKRSTKLAELDGAILVEAFPYGSLAQAQAKARIAGSCDCKNCKSARATWEALFSPAAIKAEKEASRKAQEALQAKKKGKASQLSTADGSSIVEPAAPLPKAAEEFVPFENAIG
jgi:hypothetical protein